MPQPEASQIIHASCVSIDGKGVLIVGASGSGKSSLALQLMSMGAVLVSDDRTCLHSDGEQISASAPSSIYGLIEARGVGILQADASHQAQIVLVVDMDVEEQHRLPHKLLINICGIQLPKLGKVAAPHFPAAIRQYLKMGRQDPK